MTRSIGPCCKCSRPSARTAPAGPPGRRSAALAAIPIPDEAGRPRIALAPALAACARGAGYVLEPPHAIHVAAERRVIVEPHGELDGSDDRRRRHEAEGLL